jgi:glycerophosphoryl diester phosphodiesterase
MLARPPAAEPPTSPAMSHSRPRLYAHRGAARERPENTLPAFARALELGADALELDVHMTLDGHVVVSHDPTAERMTGVRAAFREVRLAEVKRWDAGIGYRLGNDRPFAGRGITVPTLEEVLVTFPDVLLNIDLKQRQPSMVRATVELVRRLGAEERTTLASFSTRTMRAVRALGYRGPTALGRGEVAALLAMPEPIVTPWLGGASAAQLPFALGGLPMVRPALVRRCHALGLRLDVWTVNRPEEAERLAAMGVDGIMTDDPATLAPVLRRR